MGRQPGNRSCIECLLFIGMYFTPQHVSWQCIDDLNSKLESWAYHGQLMAYFNLPGSRIRPLGGISTKTAAVFFSTWRKLHKRAARCFGSAVTIPNFSPASQGPKAHVHLMEDLLVDILHVQAHLTQGQPLVFLKRHMLPDVLLGWRQP